VRTYGGYRYRRYYRPRTYVQFGFGLNTAPYYDPYVYEPAPVYIAPEPDVIVHEHLYVEPPATPVEPGPVYDDKTNSSPDGEIDVENEPPAGCYYYDTSCHQRFATLDEYTEHLDSHHHDQVISIVNSDSDETIRVLEFVDGYWQVQK
jgi:hypothetical protein